jgi:hypothetical protein
MKTRALLFTASATIVSIATFGIFVSVIAVGAPAIKKPWETRGWPKNADGSFVGVSENEGYPTQESRDTETERRKQDDAKWRKLSSKASDNENETIERIHEHSWFSGERKVRWAKYDPWWTEERLEQAQELEAKGELTLYLAQNMNLVGTEFIMKEYAEVCARRDRDGQQLIAFDDWIGSNMPRLLDKGSLPYMRIRIPPKKDGNHYTRIEMAKLILAALDAAVEKGNKEKE